MSYAPAKLTTEQSGADSVAAPEPAYDQHRSFLRMASHELRTPLNSIIGFSEIISQELHGPINDPRYKDYAGVIRASGLKLLKLVNQVLEIARLEAKAGDLNLSPEPAKPAVYAAIRALDAEASARNVACEPTIDPATPLVLMDARGLQTILTNLIQNAITFSPEGGEVEIDVRPDGGFVALSVTDQGEGMPLADIPRMLQPFVQGENALTRRGEGAGLGLSLVKLLCNEMGGTLDIRTAPGEGLTATVRLRAAS
ncbi:MAG: sensor histidine kinase [Caulobacteraceae bacterium]